MHVRSRGEANNPAGNLRLKEQSLSARDDRRANALIIKQLWPWVMAGGTILFYLYTLAPTVLWGDDAYFQRAAYVGELRADGSGHWLWLQLADRFLSLPWGDVAFRVNLLSAVMGAATVLVIYLAARALGLRRTAATAAGLSLAVSHTFWMYAVRAEVYTVFTFFLALYLWLWARWRRGDSRPLYMGAGLFGIALLAHQMALLLLPASVFLLWQRQAWLRKKEWGRLALAGALGLLPFVAVVNAQISAVAGVSFPAALRLYFTHAGIDFAPAFFDFSPDHLIPDIAVWIALLGLQFVGLAFLLAGWGIASSLRSAHWGLWLALLLLYATNLIFAISYRVNDRYVFFIPGYLVFALFVGAGWEAAQSHLRRRESWAWVWGPAGMLLLTLTPIAVYNALPRIMTTMDLNPLDIRSLPGREPNRFFLWPSKRDYRGAARYGHETLDALQPDAVLFADHTPLETLRYLQSVEGRRPDVTLVKIEPGADLAPLVRAQRARTILYVADDDPDYYNLTNLPGIELVPAGPAFQLRRVPAKPN